MRSDICVVVESTISEAEATIKYNFSILESRVRLKQPETTISLPDGNLLNKLSQLKGLN